MEARRLGRLIENMLAYSKIVDAADTYTFTAVEVAAIFNDIQEDFEAQAGRTWLRPGLGHRARRDGRPRRPDGLAAPVRQTSSTTPSNIPAVDDPCISPRNKREPWSRSP